MCLTIAYIKKIISSPSLYISILGVSMITLWGMISFWYNQLEDIHILWTKFGLAEHYNLVLNISTFRKMIMLFSALPFTSYFCKEFNNGAMYFILIRSSQNRYLAVHCFNCFFTAFGVTFIGILLCIGVLDFFYPLQVDSESNNYLGAFYSLMNEETIWIYILWTAFHYAISIGAWALSGLAVSAVFPEPFVAVCTPLIMSYVLEFITIEFDFFPDLWNLSLSHCDISNNPMICSIYIIFIFLVLAVAFSSMFFSVAKRRIKNELR